MQCRTGVRPGLMQGGALLQCHSGLSCRKGHGRQWARPARFKFSIYMSVVSAHVDEAGKGGLVATGQAKGAVSSTRNSPWTCFGTGCGPLAPIWRGVGHHTPLVEWDACGVCRCCAAVLSTTAGPSWGCTQCRLAHHMRQGCDQRQRPGVVHRSVDLCNKLVALLCESLGPTQDGQPQVKSGESCRDTQ